MSKSKALIARLLATAVFLSGCVAAPQWTRERQEQLTQTVFPGKTPIQVRNAAEQVMRLSGGNKVSFDYKNDGFTAHRPYFLYFVIGAASGTYIFDFSTSSSSNGSTGELRISTTSSVTTASGVIPSGDSSLWEGEGAYKLFYARMRHLLYGNPAWIKCDAAATLGHPARTAEPMCIGAADTAP